ncbi:MAG: matrixin family metalloprotease [Planctomycetes bacterium]|nr:matrixin family metalloprotease [Planctomycetota bacterium]
MADSKSLAKAMTTIAGAAIKAKSPFLGSALMGKRDVADGLLKLVDRKFLTNLNLGELENATVESLLKDPKFDEIQQAISNALRLAQLDSAGGLSDPTLGKKMFNWLLTAMGCDGKLERPNASNAKDLPDGAKGLPTFEYQYHFQSVPTAAFDTREAIVRCFINWQAVCGAKFSETKDPDKANVLVKIESIDGRGNTLADAHIGPSDGFQLELRIDDSEVWDTEHKFEAAICHEIGHLIGLQHTSTPGQLMNSTVGTAAKPQTEDIERAQQKWGKSRFMKKKKKKKRR